MLFYRGSASRGVRWTVTANRVEVLYIFSETFALAFKSLVYWTMAKYEKSSVKLRTYRWQRVRLLRSILHYYIHHTSIVLSTVNNNNNNDIALPVVIKNELKRNYNCLQREKYEIKKLDSNKIDVGSSITSCPYLAVVTWISCTCVYYNNNIILVSLYYISN